MSIEWKDVGGLVKNAAPILGGILGGPAGVAVGAVGNWVASALGCEATPDAVSTALQNDPESLVKIKEIERQREAQLVEFQLEQIREANKNTADARAREVALAKSGHGSAWTTSVVAVIVTLGFFVLLYVVLKNPAADSQAGLLLLGSLASAFGAVVNYYLGSSQGSRDKTTAITQAAQLDKQRGYLGALPDNATSRALAAKYQGL